MLLLFLRLADDQNEQVFPYMQVRQLMLNYLGVVVLILAINKEIITLLQLRVDQVCNP